MSEIQRYRLNVEGRPKAKNQWVAEQRHKKGGWCKWSSVQRLERQLEEAREVIGNILNITYDSEGVAGYHDNGDVALWEEFEEIQQLEEQLKEQGE